MLTPEQKARRMSGLGGSDIAAALGVSPWKTPMQLWYEKMGMLADYEDPTNAAMEWGSRLERPILDKFAEDYRGEYHVFCGDFFIRHPEYPFLVGDLDGIGLMPHRGRQAGAWLRDNGATKYWPACQQKNGPPVPDILLEAKTSGEWTPWPEVPRYYWLQVQHYLYLTGIRKAIVCVLFLPARKYEEYVIQWDESYLSLLPILMKFWQCVQEKTPLLGNIKILDDLRLGGVTIKKEREPLRLADLSDEDQHAVLDLVGLQKEQKRLAEDVTARKLQVAQIMGDAPRMLERELGFRISQFDYAPSRHYDMDAIAAALKKKGLDISDFRTIKRDGRRVLTVAEWQ